jgi:hypothetical protein
MTHVQENGGRRRVGVHDRRDEPSGTAARDHPARQETEDQRADRNVGELLQELRVAGLGIQVLFGFLLSLPFTTRFRMLDSAEQNLYLATLVLAALAIAAITAPVAYHRLVFRQHRKPELLRWANGMALCGLVCVALAVCGAVLLVLSFTQHGIVVPVLAAFVLGVFVVTWFIVPIRGREQHR